MTDAVALVVAAGRGSRMGGGPPKQYRSLGGQPLLRHALARFAGHPRISGVRAVIHADDRAAYAKAVAGLALDEPVPGGATRQESVLRGLESLSRRAPRYVLIHDGARPFVDGATIDRVLDALEEVPGAIAALPVIDTLKRGDDGAAIVATLDRSGLWRAQTPQGFHYTEILAAHRRFAGSELTDDAAVAERGGLAVRLVAGSPDNVKITTAEDLARGERWLAGAGGETRVGQGFDVHRFCPGDHVMLGGVRIAHDRGLAGHSDADAGLHAVTDALLGALGAGDIGSHFPPSDPRWRGADSAAFLRHAGALLAAREGRIVNLDLTVICETPKIGPHRAAMAARIAEILDIDAARVAVKATTTEGLGFTGRGEGIAAQAVATLRLPEGAA